MNAKATSAPARARTPRAPQQAFVLHQYDWSETSLIVELFTREQGRVAVVAKGAKRPYSQLRAVLLPFQKLLAVYGSARTENQEVQNLKSAEWTGLGLMLGGPAVLTGYYLNELLMKLLPRHDAHPALFDAYAATLPLLAAEDPARVEAALRSFELVLLREHGVLPALDRQTLTQEAVDPARRYTLRADSGLGPAADDEPGWPGSVSSGLERALDAGALDALQQICGLALADLKHRLRHLLHYHLGHQTLHTRQLMRDLQLLE